MIIETNSVNYNSNYIELFGVKKFPVNAVDLLFKFLKLEPLTALSMASKKWKDITDKAPLWKNLCREARIFPEVEYSKPFFLLSLKYNDPYTLLALAKLFSEGIEANLRIDEAIKNLNMISDDESLTISFEPEVKDWLNLLMAKKILGSANPDYEEVVRILSDLCDNQRVSHRIRIQVGFLFAKMILDGRSSFQVAKASKLLLHIINDPNGVDQNAVMEAYILIAKLHLENPTTLKTDEHASYFLQQVIKNQNSTEKQRLKAEYFKAVYICQDRDKKSTYPSAFRTFQKIKKNRKADNDLRLEAEYQSALMRAKGVIYTSDYDRVAETLLKLSNAKNASLEMQANASFYLAELVFKNCTKIVSINTAVDLMHSAFINKSLPKDIRKEAQRLLNQQLRTKTLVKPEIDFTLSKHSNSESSFEEKSSLSPSESSSDYARSSQMKQTIKKFPNYSRSSNTLHVNGKDYTAISSKTINFFDHPLASCGSSLDREVILLDPANSPKLSKHFKVILKFFTTEEQQKILSGRALVNSVFNYVRNTIFPNKLDLKSKFAAFIALKQTDGVTSQIEALGKKVLVIPIDEFISKGLGVCRHHAMVTAYILSGLTKQTSEKTKRPYLSGIVQIIRDNLRVDSAHAWVTYVTKNRKIHIDTLWNRIVNFSNPEGIKVLELAYGVEVIKRQMQKVERYQNSL